MKTENFNLYGIRFTVSGDTEKARALAYQARRMHFQLGLNGMPMMKLNYPDGSFVAVLRQAGFDFANIYVPVSGGEKISQKRIISVCNCIGIIGSTTDFASLNDSKIYEWRQGDLTDSAIIQTELPASYLEYNNAWKIGSKVKMGASWEYPWSFSDGHTYKLRARLYIEIYNSSGTRIKLIPIDQDGYVVNARRVGGANYTGDFSINYTATLDTEYHDGYTYFPMVPLEYDGHWFGTVWIDNHAYAVYNFNTALGNQYRLQYGRTAYGVVAEEFKPLFGIDDGDEAFYLYCAGCEYPSYANPGIDCPDYSCIAGVVNSFTSYNMSSGDSCLPLGFDVDNNYINQSWSLEGTITEDGVVLETSSGQINANGQIIPFGSFSFQNALTIPVDWTDYGGLEEIHHVGFRLDALRTTNGETAAIVDEYNSVTTAINNLGSLQFYCLICTPCEETEINVETF